MNLTEIIKIIGEANNNINHFKIKIIKINS